MQTISWNTNRTFHFHIVFYSRRIHTTPLLIRYAPCSRNHGYTLSIWTKTYTIDAYILCPLDGSTHSFLEASTQILDAERMVHPCQLYMTSLYSKNTAILSIHFHQPHTQNTKCPNNQRRRSVGTAMGVVGCMQTTTKPVIIASITTLTPWSRKIALIAAGRDTSCANRDSYAATARTGGCLASDYRVTAIIWKAAEWRWLFISAHSILFANSASSEVLMRAK